MAKTKKNSKKADDPCWKGYKQIGTKTKKGKTVPNCIPEKKAMKKRVLMRINDFV